MMNALNVMNHSMVFVGDVKLTAQMCISVRLTVKNMVNIMMRIRNHANSVVKIA